MKTLLVLVVGAAIGVGGYMAWQMLGRPEARACSRMQSLCGGDEKRWKGEGGEWERPPARAALRELEELYLRCPTPEILYQRAAAHETVGRDEKSIVQLKQAIELYLQYQAAAPAATVDAQAHPSL